MRFPLTKSFSLLLLLLLPACSSKKSDDAVEASGMIETTDVIVSSRVAGNILDLRVHEGDRIKKGETLAVVDDADLRLQADGFRAGVAIARAQFQLISKGTRPEDITQANEAVRQATISLKSARDDVQRLESLVQAGSIPEKSIADARTRVAIAERQLASVQANYQKFRHGAPIEEISAAKARLDQAESQLASIQKRITDCTVLAPIDGVITRRGFDVGEFVNIGGGIATISRTDPVKLKIYVPEDQLGRIKLGQTADLKIDTWADRVFHGRVIYISPTAEFTPKNVQTKDDRTKLVFEVQLEVANPDGALKSGITAEARLATKTPS